MDRLTALQVFRQVAELESFAAAARRLNLSAPAVSKNVAELEAYLGVRLINRTTRKLHLTEAGQNYLDNISRILDDLGEAECALGPLRTEPAGTLRIAAPLTSSLFGLSQALPDFMQRYPAINLNIDLNDRRVDVIRDGYDLAIRGSDNFKDTSLIARKLTVLKHVLCASPRYWAEHGPLQHPSELRQHQCIRFLHSDHADNWEFRRNRNIESVRVQGRLSVGSSLVIRDALLAGFGVSLIPRIYVAEHLASGALVPALEDWQANETAIFAVYPSRRYIAPKLRVFLDFLSSTFA